MFKMDFRAFVESKGVYTGRKVTQATGFYY